MNMKTEIWNGYKIRFVEKVPGEWWAVLADIATALSLRTDKVAARLEDDNLSKVVIFDTLGREQEMLIVNEYGIYEAVFGYACQKGADFRGHS